MKLTVKQFTCDGLAEITSIEASYVQLSLFRHDDSGTSDPYTVLLRITRGLLKVDTYPWDEIVVTLSETARFKIVPPGPSRQPAKSARENTAQNGGVA
jgi:hypothetical protein